MAECGNMPDWHPYNPPSGGRPTAPSGSQNASTGHMFISSISPPAMDGINLTSDRLQTSKHQNEASYVGRNYAGGPIAGTNCSTSSSLSSGVHIAPLAACVSHYGGSSTRNPMMDSLGGAMDPRMGPVAGINDEVAHRNSQMAFSGSTNHANATNLNVNTGPAAMQNSPVGAMSPGRQAGYGACKAPCCHPDANIPYQHWDKYGHYHGAPNAHTSYRENLRQSAYQPVDNRRYMPDMNLRKDCLDKDIVETTPFPVEHRRNFDYKYARKDSVLSRNYPNPANGMMQNYPMQNYNFPNEYQKCPYSVKDYMRRGASSSGSMNSKNSSVHKYQEQQSVIVQQKYSHSKSMQYQNGAVPSTAPSGNLPSSLQNSYYNAPQMPRDLSRDYSRDYSQEQVTNRMPQVPTSSHVHGSFQKYHVYHQKIAMQRFSVENHLRSFSRIPGYQSHPKYQECVMRYRELLRLQQTVDYQNVLQESPKVPSPSNTAPPVAPINLQFDQNGILINSNYIPGNYPGIHGGMNPMGPTDSTNASANARMTGNVPNMEQQNQFMDHNDQSINLPRELDSQMHQRTVLSHHDTNERYFITGEKNDHTSVYEKLGRSENLDTLNVDVDGVETTTVAEPNVTCVTTTTVAPSMPSVSTPSAVEYKNSKDFADKPELDVRQFLANWDESEDEDAASSNIVATSLNDQFEGAVFSSKSPSTGATLDDTVNSPNELNSQENKETSGIENNASGSSPLTDTTSEIDIETNGNSPISNSESGIIAKDIQCIRTDDGDDIPTIHIVDNLEAGTDLEKIHTVFSNLTSSVLNPISIGESSSEIVGENSGKGETIVLFEQENGVCTKTLEFSVSSEGNNSEVVEGVIASIIESSSVEASAQEIETSSKSPYKSPEVVDSSSERLATEETAVTASDSSANSVASSSCSSKTNAETIDTANLRKQNSFTSDESHNPDDISLPDLQTSECTPISTTLNTPIHSDSEESSEHVSDLTISTNPIEIIQNSPIISFTHSPIKIEPYEQLDGRMGRPTRQRAAEQLDRHDSLDFDFDREVACRENTKYTETSETSAISGVEGLESETTRAEDSLLLADIHESTVQNSYTEKTPVESERDDEFYRTADPLVGMAHIAKTVSKDQSDDAEEVCPPEVRNDENNRSNCESPVDRILRSDELDTDKCPSIMEREDDFNRSSDLEKLCDMSLDGSCMMPLISGDDCDEPTVPVQPLESSSCFTKILNESLPIEDLDALESGSDDDKLGKPDEDMWGDVRYMDKHLDASSTNASVPREKSETQKSKKHDKSEKVSGSLEETSPTKTKHHCDEKVDDTSQNDVNYKPSNLSESEMEERPQSPDLTRETICTENPQRDKSSPSPTIELQKSTTKEQKFDDCSEPEESRRTRGTEKRRSSREEKDLEDNSRTTVDSDVEAKGPLTKSYTTKHRDSNVEIHVANFNVKIHDNEVIRNETVGPNAKNHESSSDGLDAIEIKINLSRGDVNRRGGKQFQDKFTDDDRRISQDTDVRESSPQVRETNACASGKKCCRRRRRSMPDGFESKKARKLDDERTEFTEHYTAKKISKSRNSGNRHKVRRSMDDELLLNPERSRKDFATEEVNFHLEMAKAFNLPWLRDEDPETGGSSTSLLPKINESKKDKKLSTKSKGDSRTEKHLKDVRTVPSPSYNSALDNSSTMDFDNFDVAPHHSSDTDTEQLDSFNEMRYARVKKARLEDRERYKNPSSYGTSFDELASLDAFEINLNTVPIYTTKDGRITYSPNRNYTYRALIMEARQREGYPTLRKLHYPRHLTRNHYREAKMRKLYKRRQEERSGHETKRRSGDYHVGKSKRPISTRHHMEETEARLAMRSKKHENRRRDTRISSELEHCSDDVTRGFVDNCLTNKNRSVETITTSYKPETHAKVIQQREDSPVNRRSENTRKDDHADSSRNAISTYKGINSGIKNVIEDTLGSPKHYPNRDSDNCLVSKIFQGQELEISARKVMPSCPERMQNEREDCGRKSRFFPESSHPLKTPMASPLINLEKRPVGWDLEQDCQAALSDSGLESSTTYVEASKESRRIQRWKNFFADKAVTAKAVYNTPSERYIEAIDLSHEKLRTDENLRYFDDEPKDLRMKDVESKELCRDVVSCEIVPQEIQTLVVEEPKKICENIETSLETGRKRCIAETTLFVEPLDDDALKNNRMSEIVKSLDLAVTHRHRLAVKESKINNESEIVKPINNDNDRDRVKPAVSIFRRDAINCVTSKVTDALSRRASCDAIDSRESRNEFFREPMFAEIASTESRIIPEENEESEFFKDHRVVEEPENLDSQTAMSEIIERVQSPEIFQTRCKDFLIDTSTSFSSCMKMPELVSALPTESENSRLDDTSTRFAGESMDFRETREYSNDGTKRNFMPFTSRGIMDSSVMDNDTSGRDSFLCGIAENAMNASEDSSIDKKTVESVEKSAESDFRSRDSPGKAPILSFSGQITNDSRHDDSPSKSPPNLSCENSIPKLVIKKNDGISRSTSVSQSFDASRNSSSQETEKKIPSIDHDVSAERHPKIPKMIIRNVKSRPGTPTTIEEDVTVETKNSVREQRVFEVQIKLDKETTPRDPPTECKVPKMKIKLEDKQQPKMIVETSKASSHELGGEQSKNVPKVKIRKIRRSSTSRSPMRVDKSSRQSSEREMQMDFSENTENSNASSSYKFTVEKLTSKSHDHQDIKVEKIDDDTKKDRIPKLTIKKQEVGVTSGGYSSSQSLKKRRSRSPGDSGSKKQRKSTSRHNSSKKNETRSRERRTKSLDSNDGTTDSQSLTEKVPKVIIKRTSPSAEFKCELSKVGREAITKDSKWQPEVKLQRSWVLDCMAMEPGSGKLALKMLQTANNDNGEKFLDRNSRKNGEWKRSISESTGRKSSSTFEGKTRRKSDCDLNETEAQPSRMLLIGNNRSKSFDDNISANRRKSRENESTISRLAGSSSVVSNILPASDKDKKHNTKKSVKNDEYETINSAENSEESSKKQEKGETSPKTKEPNKNVGGTFEEPESSVIKLDSSDESQTTIELLPASPDNSQPESLDTIEQSSEVEQCIGNGNMGKLYSDEAIPTQFELELEIVDNSTVDSLDVPIPLPDESSIEEDSTSTVENVNRLERYKSYGASDDNDESVAMDLGCEKFVYDEGSKIVSLKKSMKSTDTNTKNVCCSDSLVKEVLAAKETLKRCLTKSKSVVRTKLKPRTKTAAEKKQGSGFDFAGLAEYSKTSKCHVEERAPVFHDTVKASKSKETTGCCSNDKAKSEHFQHERLSSKQEKKTRESSEKQDRHRKSWSKDNRQSERSKGEHISSSTSSKSSKRSSLPSTNVSPTKTGSSSSSGKTIEHETFGENSRSKSLSEKSSTNRSFKSNETSTDRQGSVSNIITNTEDSIKKNKSYKIPKISRSLERNNSEDATVTEDKRKSPSLVKMPVLEPQIDLNFELTGSDRDTSRSPPVITKHEDPEIDRETPKKLEDNVNADKLDSITKKEDSEAVTFADIVSQLAYHEKATIRHRRYCNLCERWFPSTIRHERHLSGYQHRHTELTQRRTVHALFMLFTGKPCPRLLPASIVRTDCLPGEPTPLQVAVQDVAISLEDGARVKPKKDVSSKDE